MQRNPAALTGRTFDVVVVGGGIYGLTIAYDAAQRGLSVALVERGDFGSGASFNHLRTIHGGLRYLQTLDVVRSRESIAERRTLATIAPGALEPVPFVLPLRRSAMRGATAMRAAFVLDRVIGFDRNRGLSSSHRLPPGRVVSGGRLRRFAGVDEGVDTAAVWYDYVTTEADRLTFSFALAASLNGAVVANYVDATALAIDGNRVVGIHARDVLQGQTFDVEGRVIVNATGGGVDRLLDVAGAATGIPMVKAMNLVTRREGGNAAVGGRAPSGRNLFRVPWRGRALFGTWESRRPCRADDLGIVEAEVAAFIGELNDAFPSLALGIRDVTLIHRGIVPAVATAGGLALAVHEHIRDHAAQGGRRFEGLVSVVGAKYTTARAVAERVTDRLVSKLGRPPVACRTAAAALPGVGDPGPTTIPAGVPPHLIAAYGHRYAEVLALSSDRPELKVRLNEVSQVTGAELVWAARHEMAATLADAVIRRTPLGSLGYPGDAAVDRAAELVGTELGWSIEHRRSEAAAVRRFYAAIVAPGETADTRGAASA
jgi:glycerol-3-phosphate dehydrogenase